MAQIKFWNSEIMADKLELKNIVDTIYEDVVLYIDNHQTVDEKIFIDFLHDIAHKILQNKLDNPVGLDKLTFENEYKEIAQKSLSSFTDTNNSIDVLNDTNNSIIDDCQNGSIDTEKIMQKFKDIQSQVSDEITNANKTISSLMSEIETLEKKSILDPLTKVYNRRALDDYFNKYQENKNKKEDMHVLILDIDNFKGVNDKYGHIAGDKVLIFLANLLKKILRESDKIFRYGGEEFIVAINRVDMETCRKIVERILQLVRDNKLSYKDKRIHITLSVGATIFLKGDTTVSVISRADQALYEAKGSGKDKAIYKV